MLAAEAGAVEKVGATEKVGAAELARVVVAGVVARSDATTEAVQEELAAVG